MSLRINHWTGLGRVVARPHFTPAEGETQARLFFRMAINRIKSEKADFVQVTAWGKMAEAGARYIDKGKELVVEGEIRTNSVEDANATGGYRNYFEVAAGKIGYGQDSAAKRQERELAQANSSGNSVADVASQLLANSRKKPEEAQMSYSVLIASLLERGAALTEADEMARQYCKKNNLKMPTTPKTATAASGNSVDDNPFDGV